MLKNGTAVIETVIKSAFDPTIDVQPKKNKEYQKVRRGRKLKQVFPPFIDLGMVAGRHRAQCSKCMSKFEVNRIGNHECASKQFEQLYENITENKCKLCGKAFLNVRNARKHLRQKQCRTLKKISLQESSNGDYTTISPTPPSRLLNDKISNNRKQTCTATASTISLEPAPSRIYIVVDTNVFMKFLTTVEDLLARDDKPFIVVPYRVHSELNDIKLKINKQLNWLKRNPTVLYTANGRKMWKQANITLHNVCKANSAMNLWVRTHSQHFLGQSAVDHYGHLKLVSIQDADEEILNFSHQLKAKYHNEACVIILSEDVNFLNRANATLDTPIISACAPPAILSKLNELNNGVARERPEDNIERM